jgi:hypothetical protein
VELWENSRKTFEDPETRYLFDPFVLQEIPFEKVISDMRRHSLSKKQVKDAEIW